MVRVIPAAAVLLSLAAAAAGLSGCDDNSMFAEARIITDTVTIAVPGSPSGLHSALDLVREAPPFALLRRPERTEDAQQWDLALRRVEGGLALRPYSAPGSGLRGAGLAPAGTDFDRLERAPRGIPPYQYEQLAISEGASYVFRSRIYGGGCTKYAKGRILETDLEAGTARMVIAINENCEDERLTD